MSKGMHGPLGGQYKPLDSDQLARVHDISMRLLEEVGLQVNHEGALDLFEKQGAQVDRSSNTVRLERGLVRELISHAPSEVTLCGRDPDNDIKLGGSRVHLGTGGTALNVLDLDSGEKRLATLRDVALTARLVDALDNLHFIVLPLYPNELDKEVVDVNRFLSGLLNSSKHIMGGIYTREGALDVIHMAEIIAGGPEQLRERPFISMITCVMSPLKLDRTYTELLLTVAEQGIPLAIPAEPLSGATSPVTLAGTLAQANAETLGGIALAQAANPGTPVLYGSVATIADMRTMSYLSGAVEMGLLNATGAQLAQYYGLPFYATAGMSDAKLPDVQAGYEKAMTTAMVALAGANFIHDAAGLLEFAMTVAYEQYVIDNEIVGMALRAVEGIDVTEDTLAVEPIAGVGPGGHFVDQEHTVRFMRKEFFYPTIADRNNRSTWENQGSLTTRERARATARKLLAEHEPLPIEPEICQRLQQTFPGLVELDRLRGGV